jgi:hypothetical protein
MFVDGQDGRVDDYLALVRPWGFDVAAIAVPVGVWFDRQDIRSPLAHAEWLLSHVSSAERHEYTGGHDPDDDTSRKILGWLEK